MKDGWRFTLPRQAPAAQPGPPIPDLSPEARRKQALKWHEHVRDHVRLTLRGRAMEVIRRVATGAWNDGFIHAGNLAYMSLVAIFPFFIVGAAIFALLGEADQAASITWILAGMPPAVRGALEPVARDVIVARSGWVLWAGAAVALWTVGSLIETLRDILRRAYGTRATLSFWHYRLISTGIIIIAVILLIASLLAQVAIGTAQEVIDARIPDFSDLLAQLALSRLVPAATLYLSLHLLFFALAPAAYRHRRYPKWPGALLVTLWSMAVTVNLPRVLRLMASWDLTYGSLAGIMIALFFFWLVGLGIVIGAELNAALAITPEEQAVLEKAGAEGDRDQSEGDASA